MTIRATIRSLRLSGWPRHAIRHLLRCNHPELSPTWIAQEIRRESQWARCPARKQRAIVALNKALEKYSEFHDT
jgi:hypothetical protein